MEQINKTLSDVEKKLEPYFTKNIPLLPPKAIDFLVKIIPYLSIVGIILTAQSLLMIFGIGAVFSPIAYLGGFRFGLNTLFVILWSVLSIAITIKAIPGLFKKQLSAWKLMFALNVLSVIYSILTLHLFSAVLGGIISFYLLFQLKKQYT